MKRLIYMLLLFVVLGHTVFAQEQKAEPLEVRLLDGFFPLGGRLVSGAEGCLAG
ncbi:hypothetical protein NXX89_05380 [Bacteroides thetaiotaomicron]|nr:hypothetical protein [Bacteroides thetaiotaomicron]MCS3210981.1 hypothetical protein [Bacteroides thetaiotaomicron]